MFLLEWSFIPCIHIHSIICPWPFDSDSAADSYLPSSCYWQPGLIYTTGINYKEGLLFSLILLRLSLWSLRIVWLWLSLYARDRLKAEVRCSFAFEYGGFWITRKVSDVLPKWWGRRALIGPVIQRRYKRKWDLGIRSQPVVWCLQTSHESLVPLCGQTLVSPTPWWLSFGWISLPFPCWFAAPKLLCTPEAALHPLQVGHLGCVFLHPCVWWVHLLSPSCKAGGPKIWPSGGLKSVSRHNTGIFLQGYFLC